MERLLILGEHDEQFACLMLIAFIKVNKIMGIVPFAMVSFISFLLILDFALRHAQYRNREQKGHLSEAKGHPRLRHSCQHWSREAAQPNYGTFSQVSLLNTPPFSFR
ncbi:hypothetical protein DN752_01855 [Echinicola strongylocentroti]|uniref:Uncharacterized protein n=1 Tax=Echinicola strongylocentroti TaxID=1795355 RepID=A0A2Z4IEB3_9BACT|nr:hypothetical protein DN752_01855 [Echinicola strongylocentroti]